ncbi:MAG: DUF3575 domain-containing protein [Cytophagales bacterium]|nr:DUF3575 domain-containing protein [Cytophagales bacterium]
MANSTLSINHYIKYIICVFGFIIVFFSNISYAQNDTIAKKSSVFILKFAPLSLVDFIYTTIQFAGELSLKDKTSYQLELGYMSNFLSIRENNNQGYRIRSEVRFYKKQNFQGIYLTPEILFINVKYDYARRFSKDTLYPYSSSYIDTIEIKKIVLAATFKIGYQKIFKSNIVLDFYGGLGLRYINTKHLFFPQTGYLFQHADCWSCQDDTEGDRFIPNVSLGFKVGYLFNLSNHKTP